MTGRTHDLAAFTALNLIFLIQPEIPRMTLATGIVAFSANMLGGLAPDLDQSTSTFWKKLPAGTVFGRILSPLFGGHRFISHSLLGIFLFGFLLDKLLFWASSFLIVDMNIVWWAFMIGFISHLFMDTFTHDGVPWLFPVPFNIGIPPFKFLRMKTGGFLEQVLVFPGLLLLNGYLIYTFYPIYLEFFKSF